LPYGIGGSITNQKEDRMHLSLLFALTMLANAPPATVPEEAPPAVQQDNPAPEETATIRVTLKLPDDWNPVSGLPNGVVLDHPLGGHLMIVMAAVEEGSDAATLEYAKGALASAKLTPDGKLTVDPVTHAVLVAWHMKGDDGKVIKGRLAVGPMPDAGADVPLRLVYLGGWPAKNDVKLGKSFEKAFKERALVPVDSE
jgi:hypothetical protein